MKIVGWLILLIGVFGISLAAGVAARRWQTTEVSSQPVAKVSSQRGAMLYTLHCAKCHGDEGRGDAEGAEKLVPPPRDFASRPWRYEPAAESIERVISRGIAGTSMPAFEAALLEPDIEALTQHVLELAKVDSPVDRSDDPFRAAKFTPLASARHAPVLEVEAADGSTLSLASLQGKVVLLNFWGVSCEHCLAKMPGLVKLNEQVASPEFVVLNICADEDEASAAQEMLSAVAPSLTAYVDTTGLAHGRFEVSLMPTLWLVDREGRLVAKGQGARDWQDPALVALIEQLLAQSN